MDVPALTEAFERVAKKQKVAASTTEQVIQKLLYELVQARKGICSGQNEDMMKGDPGCKAALAGLNVKLQEMKGIADISAQQKDLNLALQKFGKQVEKSTVADISQACREVDFDQKLVDQVIAQHLYREGHFELGDCFVKEASVQLAASLKTPFQEMYQILEQVRVKNLEPALAWARVHRAELAEKGNGSFEFKLHQLHFVHLLHKQGRQAALQYARNNFGPFASSHLSEIQRLMGCLLWAGRLETSPYADLLAAIHWDSVAAEFTHECCNLVGQAYESPLHVTLTAGSYALPKLLKLVTVLATKRHEWQSMKQLPVDIELGKKYQFHSIFACPVSREQSSAENPPMLMPCGHVLCKQSILKLGKGNSRTFKCPYCPAETTASNCRPIQL
eukprot:jgi/Mesen1/7379/ME000382S06574